MSNNQLEDLDHEVRNIIEKAFKHQTNMYDVHTMILSDKEDLTELSTFLGKNYNNIDVPTVLGSVARKGNEHFEAFKMILDFKPYDDINELDMAWFNAFRKGQHKIIKLLVDRGYNEDIKTEPFLKLIRKNRVELMNYFLEDETIYINKTNINNMLSYAIYYGRLEMVKLFLKFGADDYRNMDMITMAVDGEFIDIIIYLLRKIEDVETLKNIKTMAVNKCRKDIVKLIDSKLFSIKLRGKQ